MLKNHLRPTNRDTFAAIGAFRLNHNHGAIFPLINSFFGADILTFAALDTDPWLECPRLRE
jgi:hypothetical protein